MESKFVPGRSKVHYSGPIYGNEEVRAAINTLLDGWLVSGPKVREFEKKLSGYVGARDTVAVNSGSSANLLCLACLRSQSLRAPLKKGDEVITSALTFPTTINPIIQNGLTPVFVDIDNTLNMDLHEAEKAIGPKTRALMVLHFLGSPVNMTHALEIAERNDLYVIEDACDGLGSSFNNKKVGSFGDMGTLSFYPAHHITTLGEGGAILANDEAYPPILRSLRDWGRACVCPICKITVDPDYNCPIRHKTDTPELKGYDKRYLYTEIGYNLKMTEIQGSVGLVQLSKHHNLSQKRKENAEFTRKSLSEFDALFVPPTTKGGDANWFALPILLRPDLPFSRNDIIEWLERHNVETRPLFAGNILSHPAYHDIIYKIPGDLKNTNWARDNGFFIGCYAGITNEQREYVIEVIKSFFKGVPRLDHTRAQISAASK